MAQDQDKIASSDVVDNGDGSYEATVVTENGQVGSGYSSDGIILDGSAEEALVDAADGVDVGGDDGGDDGGGDE